MARYKSKSVGQGNVVMVGLGQIVGLVLGLYVFDQIIDATIPNLYTCPSWSAFNPAANNCLNISGGVQTTAYTATYFSTAATFVTSLLPVLGILGTFYIVWRTLKKAGMA